MTKTKRVIISIKLKTHNSARVHYGRRMYAVARKYTPEVVEVGQDSCLAEITGLRTFFKMTYKQMIEKILAELTLELGMPIVVAVATEKEFDSHKKKPVKRATKARKISTYSELDPLFSHSSFTALDYSLVKDEKHRLIIPFLGEVN